MFEIIFTFLIEIVIFLFGFLAGLFYFKATSNIVVLKMYHHYEKRMQDAEGQIKEIKEQNKLNDRVKDIEKQVWELKACEKLMEMIIKKMDAYV